MAGPAVLPECSLCGCPTGESTKNIEPRTRWCSIYCPYIAKEAGWYEGCGRSPREIYLEKYSKSMTMKCDLCTSPKRIYVSSYCPGCDELVCGKCTTEEYGENECGKCGTDMYDCDGYLMTMKRTDLSVEKRRVCGRIVYGLGVRDKKYYDENEVEYRKDLMECLEECINMGDIQCRYSKLVSKMKGYVFKDFVEFYHLAILGHSTARRKISDYWYENTFDTDEDHAILDKKSLYWTKMAALALDGMSLCRMGKSFLKKGKDLEALGFFMRSVKYYYFPAYAVLGQYWMVKNNETLARNNYYEGTRRGCHMSEVMVGIYQTEGKIGIPKDVDRGMQRIFVVLKLGPEIGETHSAVVTARSWLASVYYGNECAGVTHPDIEPDRKLALDLLEDGVANGDAVCMTIKARILICESLGKKNSTKDITEATKLIQRAISLGCREAKNIVVPK